MMTALAGVQFILCVFFVKEYSLKRDDDEKQKEAAKAWLKERRKKKREENVSDQVLSTATTQLEERWEVEQKV